MSTGNGRTVGVAETFSSPRRVQKRLFTSGSGSSKRNLFHDNRISSPNGGNSGDESDLGPMSPLALSDATNSPGVSLHSPLAAHVSAPPVSLASLDSSLRERVARNEGRDGADAYPSSPFSVLKMLTNSARYSQHRKVCLPLPKSAPGSDGDSEEETLPITPKRTDQMSAWNEAITETPRRRFGREIQNEPNYEPEIIAETPQKEDSPDKRLITPLGSVSKEAALPRLHHRKSLISLSLKGNSSPIDRKENTLKRTARNPTVPASLKLFKSDECPSIPKARAALFQEKKEEFKLSTKSFYSSPTKSVQTQELPTSVEKSYLRRGQKRRSLPAKSNRGRSTKRHRHGEINAGIGHGIRKPKLKRHVSCSEVLKKEKAHRSPTLMSARKTLKHVPSTIDNVVAVADSATTLERCAAPMSHIASKQSPSSPEVEPGKKFFKTNRTLARNSLATVTVNDTIKLQVSNGKLKLEPHQTTRPLNPYKKLKSLDLKFDANDLTVDDPNFAVPIDGTSVDNILKVLEDDWADDEYDTMEPLTTKQIHAISPLKTSIAPVDVTMSPASELSSMTSLMNIKDIVGRATKVDCNPTNADRSEKPKFYPLFHKKFDGNRSLTGTSKKVGRGTKRPIGWQLSSKSGIKDDRQYQLDAGQKRFGAIQCPECRVVYQIGEPDDERSHRNYHDSRKILKFSGWKQERIVGTDPYTSSRMILVEPGDPKHCWKKVSDILQVVDQDLGLTDTKSSDYHNDKIYLYIRDKEIIGVLVAECVAAGYRMIPDLIDIDCCSLESSAVKCGVKVIWTTMRRRRQGVATKLMDVLRANFYFGYVLSVDDIAFSMPTPGGKAFAEKYTNTRCFKVYN